MSKSVTSKSVTSKFEHDISLVMHASDSSAENEVGAPIKKKRCLVCNKKVGLLGFKCRCDGVFCAVHRSEGAHDCSFNFASMGNQVLAERLVAVGGKRGLE